MRVAKYYTAVDADKKTFLVREDAHNYPELEKLNNPGNVKKMLDAVFHASNLAEEHAWMIALNTSLQVIGVFEISHGSIDYAFMGVREVFVRLCLCGASKFIVAHNHPSGTVNPSQQDIDSTNQLREAGKLMGIPLVDHLIVGGGNPGYFSFQEAAA